MKKHKSNQKIAMLVAIALLFTMLPISAAALKPQSETISFEGTALDYQVYANKDIFLEKCQSGNIPAASTQADAVQRAAISNLSVEGFGERVNLGLTIEGQSVKFVGALYPIVGGGYYDDKLVLGEFAGSSAYNIVLFQISKALDFSESLESPTLTSVASSKNMLKIVLENLVTGEVYNVSMCISDSQFAMFHSAALSYYNSLNIETSSDRYWEIAHKTLSLWNINDNWNGVGTNETTSVRAGSSFTYNSISPQNVGQFLSKTNLNNFFLVMDNYGYSNYSSTTVMGGALRQTGWKTYYSDISSGQYFYIMYGVEVGDGSYNVQISYCTYSTANNGTRVATHLEVKGSVLVRYAPEDASPNCTLVYSDGGPELTDFYLCQSELAGDNTFFTDSYLTFSLLNNKSPWAGFLISSIPHYGNLVVNIWNSLSVASETVSNWGQGYEKTILAQIESYGGLIKDICARTKTASLRFDGHYLDLAGIIDGPYSSHKVKFKFTAKSAI